MWITEHITFQGKLKQEKVCAYNGAGIERTMWSVQSYSTAQATVEPTNSSLLLVDLLDFG